MIRVGVVGDSFEVGGQERTCLEVLRRLDRDRFAPHLYVFRPGRLLAEVRALGVPLEVGHDKPGAEPGWTAADDAARAAWAERLAGCLARDRIDVCLVYAWPEAIPAAQAAGVPALVERVDGPALSGRIRDKAACHRIICESRHGRDVLLAQRAFFGCRRERMVVIPNGVDLGRFDPGRYGREECRARLGLDPQDFVVGAVARLTTQKNFGQLLRGARRFVDRSPAGPRLQIVVAGPDRGKGPMLVDEARGLGIADRVHFLGARDDVPEILRALDVYAVSSLHEGTSSALLEAMAMQLPIVATQVAGAIEVVQGNGLLVPVMESVELGDALVELAGDPRLAVRLARRSRQLAVRRYDVARMVRAYEDVLTEALAMAKAEGAAVRERAS